MNLALVEWNWTGHHPTYFAHFVLALEELGASVLAICPCPDEARQTVARLRMQRGLAPSREDQTVYRQAPIQGRRFQNIRPARVSAIDWTVRHFLSVEKIAKTWQTESGKRLDLVFYACIFDWDFEWFQYVQPFLNLPWSGIYMLLGALRRPGQPGPITGRVPRPQTIFRGPLCKAAIILDEGMASQFGTLTGKPVVVFPDLTDERLPSDESGRMLENRLRKFANGPPIVSLFGLLMKSKGVFPLALVSRHPGMSETCFAFGGELLLSSFTSREAATLADILTSSANTWNHLMRIPDGEHMNSVLSTCDVLYAAYLDFPNSSNIMTKAALLKKPLIVSDGYLMAERVRRFKLGEVVPQGDVEAIAKAITKITQNPKAWVAENQPRWSDYLREHSFDRLKEAFRELWSKL